MAVVVPSLPALAGELALYYTTDPLLANSPVLAFHGPASSIGATSSRIQVHIFTPAGCCSYSRLAISPTSPFWSAVNNLPREEQGDEVCRGLAFGLKKYFCELSDNVKKEWCIQNKAPAPAALFGDDHIAILATRMTKIDNVLQAVDELQQALSEQRLSWIDVDVIMPPGSIKEPPKRSDSAGPEDLNDDADLLKHRYGQYSHLVAALGESTFLPTSKMRRAPSKANSLGRSASFLKQQKEKARRELTEVLETETSYVERITELQNLSQTLGADLKPSSRTLLQQVFPPGLKEIVEVNNEFLKSLRATLDATEQTALQDIESMTEQAPTAQQARADFIDDTQGIVAVAKCFCDLFPTFVPCYSQYLQAQAASAHTLRDMLRSEDSALGATLTAVGEQRLTSLLIEPVQRLPRYSLYIDNVTKQLPARHPALKHLLKARDIISDICAQDDKASDVPASEKLSTTVSQWPSDLLISGRLVTAVDCIELVAPFNHDTCKSDSGMLLLFTDCLVMLEKTGPAVMTARGLLAELESTSMASAVIDTRPATPKGLRFVHRFPLGNIECSETQDNRAIQLMSRSESMNPSTHDANSLQCSQTLYFEGSYEGKCSRFVEELSKARIEGRFSETERESFKWEIRASDPRPDLTNIHSAVYEDSNPEHFKLRGTSAASRIVVDLDKHSQRPRAGQHGIRSVFVISPVQEGLWRLSVDSIDGSFGRENLPTDDVLPSIRKKLAVLASLRFGIQNPYATVLQLVRNEAILRSLDLQAAATDNGDKPAQPVARERPRSMSPVKMLSSLLSSTGPGSNPPSFSRKGSDHTPSSLGSIPRMAPPVQSQTSSKPSSRDGRPPSRDPGTPQSISFTASSEHLVHSAGKIEDTLNSYLLALQARKGNIVGRNLKMRHTANELAVNELYNSLLEDPSNMVLAAQASVDVLFAAFEKFLNIAWKQQVGQVVPISMFAEIQSKAESMFPADFDEYFRDTLLSLPPQNNRAFKSIMKLLADLLDGTGNDGDRGILTVAFLEMLVTDGNPHDYIALIDRFVDDTETYFGEPLEESKQADTSVLGHKRSRSTNTPSLTSNTSSLRRKFGFGSLSRDNSKVELDSKVASVWRALSKNKIETGSPAGSISRGSLHRSQSTDVHPGLLPRRPSSQEGPTSRANAFEDTFAAASTSNLGLSTIGEHPTFIPTSTPSGPAKKKRRSSLSDLHKIQAAEPQMPVSPPAGRRALTFQRILDEKALPSSPQPTTPSSKGGSGRFGTPIRETPRSKLPASFRKEPSPGLLSQSAQSTSKAPDEVIITTSRPNSHIPTPRTRLAKVQETTTREGLHERGDAGNVVKRPSPSPEKAYKTYKPTGSTTTTPSTKRLRMQSPQKLRERLQNEQSSLISTQTSFMDELNKIGEEISSTPTRIGSIRASGSSSTRIRGGGMGNVDLAARVLKMQDQVPSEVEDLRTRIASIQKDVSSSLTVSENKCKKLDGLYREANAENEALYNRFNDELGKILRAVKGGEGVEEVKKQLGESQEEALKLRRENQRLKRENAGLRAQLKE
ncbi:hypothetical protein K431DRAFT_282567 [Polychaeton citri CBS 116435]|uniref:DH domain-containing protein n=1 Tax=Polychaeton citri CBS 116435 TaxID=1314669 RepID=A0A9P4QFR3_9PEZI|nr:hypothetical protein K431DRAFT_282567 [Polychaeton citri CBS 116435]